MVNLPDFDDMLNITVAIGNLKKSIAITSILLDDLRAEIATTVTEDKAYWVNGKPPSASHIRDTYMNIGYNSDNRKKLMELRKILADNTGELKRRELEFQVYQDMIDVWRTQSANERKANTY